MQKRETRFADFECVLLRLGFQRKATTGPQRLYEYASEDTWILLPAYTPEASVQARHLFSARKLIAERGITTEETFDRMLSEGAPQGDCPEEPLNV